MAINRELIEARIREINDTIRILKELIEKDFERLTLHEKFSMRYLVIQLVEAASSICAHILYIVFNERIEGFPECFSRLGVKDIIPEALALKLASAARLRNLLVHRYWIISDKKVYENVKDGLKDFEDFTLYIRERMEKFGSKRF
ncbi:MAG: HepT-like ribonuclease domain-containing protein [Nitrososphaerales archaeon]